MPGITYPVALLCQRQITLLSDIASQSFSFFAQILIHLSTGFVYVLCTEEGFLYFPPPGDHRTIQFIHPSVYSTAVLHPSKACHWAVQWTSPMTKRFPEAPERSLLGNLEVGEDVHRTLHNPIHPPIDWIKCADILSSFIHGISSVKINTSLW